MRRVITSCAAVAAVSIRSIGTRVFTRTHEWAEYANGEATIGVTNHAQEQLGDVVFVSLPKPGDTVAIASVLAELESVKATSSLYSPVDGVVSAVNEEVEKNPGLINEAAEAAGWMVKVKCSELPKNLLTQAEYNAILEQSQGD